MNYKQKSSKVNKKYYNFSEGIQVLVTNFNLSEGDRHKLKEYLFKHFNLELKDNPAEQSNSVEVSIQISPDTVTYFINPICQYIHITSLCSIKLHFSSPTQTQNLSCKHLLHYYQPNFSKANGSYGVCDFIKKSIKFRDIVIFHVLQFALSR